MFRALAAAAAVLALLAVPAAAQPGPPFHTIGVAANGRGVELLLLGDGDRYVTWSANDGTYTVLDAHTGKRRSDLVPAGCWPEALGSGLLVYACDGADRPERIVDLASGRTIEIEGLADFRALSFEPPYIVGVGRQWVSANFLEFTGPTYHRRYLNWHTGRVVSGPITGREIQNLDTRRLAQPMCAPFTRPPEDNELPFQDLAYQYRGGYGIRVGTPRRDDLVLSRCGSRRRVVLARARPGEYPPVPGLFRNGIVTWQAGRFGAYVVRTHRLFRWIGSAAALTHAGDHVFRAVPRDKGGFAIQRARVRH